MIDKQQFAQWMGILADRFNRSLAPPTQRAYYAVLSRALTTAEFTAGAERCFTRCTYWPSPAEILEAARPTPSLELAGAEVFADMLRWIGSPTLMDEASRRLSAPAFRAFLAVGGPAKFRALTIADEPFVRKAFVAAFVAATRDAGEAAAAGEAIARAPDYKRVNNGPQPIAALLGEVLP